MSTAPHNVDGTLPAWAETAKQTVLASTAWTTMRESLYAAMQAELRASRTPFFTDLTDAEKHLLLDRAVRTSPALQDYSNSIRLGAGRFTAAAPCVPACDRRGFECDRPRTQHSRSRHACARHSTLT